jgi:hypothetical protein
MPIFTQASCRVAVSAPHMDTYKIETLEKYAQSCPLNPDYCSDQHKRNYQSNEAFHGQAFYIKSKARTSSTAFRPSLCCY